MSQALERTCAHCGDPLPPDRRRARFCSRACQLTAYNARRKGGEPRRRQRRAGHRTGTRHWLNDPTIAVCSRDECFWDASSCPAHTG